MYVLNYYEIGLDYIITGFKKNGKSYCESINYSTGGILRFYDTTVEGFYKNISEFEEYVKTVKQTNLDALQESIEYTFFKKLPFFRNGYDKIYNPTFDIVETYPIKIIDARAFSTESICRPASSPAPRSWILPTSTRRQTEKAF